MKKILLLIVIIAMLSTIVGCQSAAPSITLEEAKATHGLTVLTPTSLPDGIQLKDIRKITEGSNVILNFKYVNEKSKEEFIISATNIFKELEEIPGSEKIEINGDMGYISHTQGVTVITWNHKNTSLELVGKISEEKAIQIANSMK